MIDINTPAARDKLATLPRGFRITIDTIADLVKHWQDTVAYMNRDSRVPAGICQSTNAIIAVAETALNAAIVAAFEPLTAPDLSADVCRILSGDA